MLEKIVILDFGSQTTQLIARRVRELNTYCEILPYNKYPQNDSTIKGVILSGSPFSVYDKAAFKTDLRQFIGKLPVLGICYGAQLIAEQSGGSVEPAVVENMAVQTLLCVITTKNCLMVFQLVHKYGCRMEIQ